MYDIGKRGILMDKEKKRNILIIGSICIAVLFFLILFIFISRNSFHGKDSVGNLTYVVPENPKSIDKNSGKTTAGSINWNSKTYHYDGLVFEITKYDFYNMDNGSAKSENLKTTKVGDVTYYYKETKMDETHVLRRYYTQVKNDTYYIMILYRTDRGNRKITQDFLESIQIKEK